MTLLEQLAQQMGCDYISDLRYLDWKQRRLAVRLLEQLPGGSPAEREEAVSYLASQAKKYPNSI